MSAQHTNKLTAVALGSRDAHRYLPAGSSGRGALVVLAATVAMAMGFGGLGLITVFMGPIEADLRWSRSDTSLGYALSTAGMAIGGLFWGRLSDRMDVRILLAIGATGMVASLLAMSILQSLSAFYIAHVVYGGFGFSVLYAPLLSTSGEWFPERRGLVTGLVTAGGAIGQGLLPFLASFLINAFGWRWAFVGIGCSLLAALALALPMLRWPKGTRAPVVTFAGASAMSRTETVDGGLSRARRLPLLPMHGRPGGAHGELHWIGLRLTERRRQQPGHCDDCRRCRPRVLWFDRRQDRPSESLCNRFHNPDGVRGGFPGPR